MRIGMGAGGQESGRAEEATTPTIHPDLARYPRVLLATCCIPWRAANGFDEDHFRASVRRLVDDGIPDLYVFGTAGEGHAVTDRVFASVTRAFVDEARSAGGTPMVGVISSSLPTVLERIELAAGLGCDLFQISLPNWGAMLDAEVSSFFDVVCGRYPTLRFLHYNVARAGRVLRPDDYVRLAADHRNLVGTKYGGGDLEVISGLLLRTPTLRHFLTEPGFFTGCTIGRCGLLGSIAMSNPSRALEYFRAGLDGSWLRFGELHRELLSILLELREALGTERRVDGAYDKVIAKVADPTFPLDLLPPWQSPTEQAYLRYRAALEQHFPSWIRAASTS
jgi:dihydrodipicolinate synthase/N-acetylneuraminate lyase